MFTKKEFAIVSNLRFISRANFILSRVEYVKKRFITPDPGVFVIQEYPRLSIYISTLYSLTPWNV